VGPVCVMNMMKMVMMKVLLLLLVAVMRWITLSPLLLSAFVHSISLRDHYRVWGRALRRYRDSWDPDKFEKDGGVGPGLAGFKKPEPDTPVRAFGSIDSVLIHSGVVYMITTVSGGGR
jgi:hypothetical protein